MSCQGCIHFTRTAHLCLDICSLLRFVGKDSEGSWWGPTGTHETGIKDRASITTDFGIHAIAQYRKEIILGTLLSIPVQYHLAMIDG